MFYISTFGGSGSLWVAKALSLHPKVICFHGSIKLPPDSEKRFPNLDPDKYAWGLRQSEGGCHGLKVFGSIHGFHGVIAKKAVEHEGGVFGGLLRNPILRVNSLWKHYHSTDAWDTATPFILDARSGHLSIPENVQVFSALCHGTVGGDVELIENLPSTHLFKFEDITNNRESFKVMFDTLVGRDGTAKVPEIAPIATARYLDEVFKMKPANVRAASSHNASEVFESWPGIFQKIFASTIEAFGGRSVTAAYENLEFDLPSKLRASIKKESRPRALVATAPIHLEYRSIGVVNTPFLNPNDVASSPGGASFLGYSYVVNRDQTNIRVRIKANAYCLDDNEVTLIASIDGNVKPAYIQTKPVSKNAWASFELEFEVVGLSKGVTRNIDVKIGTARLGEVIINGPDGNPPKEIGFPTLDIIEY